MERARITCTCGHTYDSDLSVVVLTSIPPQRYEEALIACPQCGRRYERLERMRSMPNRLRSIVMPQEFGVIAR